MKEYVCGGRVTDGALQPHDLKAFRAAMKQFYPGEVLISVTKPVATRSIPQNNLWWGYIVRGFSEHCGEPPKVMHEILKQELLGEHHLLPGSDGVIVREVTIPGSTRTLTTVQFTDLVNAAQEFGGTLGIEWKDRPTQWVDSQPSPITTTSKSAGPGR